MLIANGISHPKFNCNIVLKARKSLCDLCKVFEDLNELISNGYVINVVIICLDIIYIGTNFDFVINKLKQSYICILFE